MSCTDIDVDVGLPMAVPLVDLDEFRGLSGARRDQAFLSVEREMCRLQALQAAMLSEVKRSCSFVDDGHLDATSWLRAVINCSRSTAGERVRTADTFTDLPQLAAAVAEGGVGSDQVRLLSRMHANPRCRPQLPGWEDELVGYARTLTLWEFRQVCQDWEQRADPDGTHRDHDLSWENRSVRCSRVGAGHMITVEGDALSGDVLAEILDAHAHAELETDLAKRVALYGDQARMFPLARTARQRRYDALVTIFLKAAETTATCNRLPLVNIFCTQTAAETALRNYLGGDTAAGSDGDGDAIDPESLRLPYSRTASGAPVDTRDLVVALLIGHIRRVIVDGVGRVTDLGRRSRLFTGATREAVLLSGDRCTQPGCEERGPRIQIDHLDPWTLLGVTNPDNGSPKCATHNRTKHTARITVTRDHTGWHHYRPDGTEIAPRNH